MKLTQHTQKNFPIQSCIKIVLLLQRINISNNVIFSRAVLFKVFDDLKFNKTKLVKITSSIGSKFVRVID